MSLTLERVSISADGRPYVDLLNGLPPARFAAIVAAVYTNGKVDVPLSQLPATGVAAAIRSMQETPFQIGGFSDPGLRPDLTARAARSVLTITRRVRQVRPDYFRFFLQEPPKSSSEPGDTMAVFFITGCRFD